MKTKIEISVFDPCKESIEFRLKFNSFEEAWNVCHRGDWMLWIAKRLNVNKRKLTLVKALCAKTVIHLMKDERSINAVNVAENYGNNLVSDEELSIAAYAADAAAADDDAAYAAAYAADDTDAADAAAADAADAAAYAAAYAAADAYAADAAAAAYTAKTKNQLETAEICRRILTGEVFEKINLLINEN